MLSQNQHLPQSPVQKSSQSDNSLKTLVDIQKHLLDCQDIPTAYRTTLERLQNIPQVSRVAIVEAYRPNSCELSDCWENEWWAGNPPSRRKRRAGRVSSIFHTLSPSWLEALSQGKSIVGTLESLPPLERELLNRQGIAAILIVPLMVNRQLHGAIRFEKTRDCRNWLSSEIALLEGVAIALSLKLEQLSALAESSRAAQLQDEGVAAVAHELRSPLAHIQMIAQLLEVSLHQEGILDTPTSPIAHHLQLLQAECQRKNSMINDLLALSCLNAPIDPSTHTEIPLQVWVPYLTEIFQERFEQQQQYLEIDIPPHLPSLKTDLTLIERILTELLHNANKYTPAGGTIKVSGCYCQDGQNQLCLNLINSGVEISAADLPHIFDKFYRIPSLDVWNCGGTGLGLPLVKKMVEQLNATIQVSSGDQQVKFTLRFPL
jgi:signal transduction histidine kinase